jgi:hypothetical protein
MSTLTHFAAHPTSYGQLAGVAQVCRALVAHAKIVRQGRRRPTAHRVTLRPRHFTANAHFDGVGASIDQSKMNSSARCFSEVLPMSLIRLMTVGFGKCRPYLNAN